MSIYHNYNEQRNNELPQRYKQKNNLIELHRNMIENINKRKEKEVYIKDIEENIKDLVENILK